MQHQLIWFLGLALLLGSCQEKASETTKTDERPNIIIILADDMGYSDLGCMGSEINTPTLDRLAENGMLMTQFYNAGRCCPTRASLLTGLYPHQAGMGSMTYNLPELPSYQGYLNQNCVTIAEALGGAGYTTLMSGKWHLGDHRPHWPGDRGFDQYFSFINGATSYYNLDQYRPGRAPLEMTLNGEPYTPGEGFYMTDAISDYATQFIQEQKDSTAPFFLYMAYTAPHWPLHAPESEIAKYRNKYKSGWAKIRQQRYDRMLELGIIDSAWALSPAFPDPEKVPDWETLSEEEQDLWDLRMATYAAMIDRMDQGIGKVVQQLEAQGELENTLIVFLSDNGGCHEEVYNWNIAYDQSGKTGGPNSFDAYGFAWANVSNTPFRLFKSLTMEGGISTPLIAHFPKMIEGGQKNNAAGHVTDLMPTCLDLADATYPEEFRGNTITPTPGKSLVPVFKEQRQTHRDLIYWEHNDSKAIRKGDWKLVLPAWGGPDDWALYDLKADRSELNNLAGQHPEKAEEMRLAFESWADSVGVMPWPEVKKIRKNR